jgi:hypothetical protein
MSFMAMFRQRLATDKAIQFNLRADPVWRQSERSFRFYTAGESDNSPAVELAVGCTHNVVVELPTTVCSRSAVARLVSAAY